MKYTTTVEYNDFTFEVEYEYTPGERGDRWSPDFCAEAEISKIFTDKRIDDRLCQIEITKELFSVMTDSVEQDIIEKIIEQHDPLDEGWDF